MWPCAYWLNVISYLLEPVLIRELYCLPASWASWLGQGAVTPHNMQASANASFTDPRMWFLSQILQYSTIFKISAYLRIKMDNIFGLTVIVSHHRRLNSWEYILLSAGHSTLWLALVVTFAHCVCGMFTTRTEKSPFPVSGGHPRRNALATFFDQ